MAMPKLIPFPGFRIPVTDSNLGSNSNSRADFDSGTDSNSGVDSWTDSDSEVDSGTDSGVDSNSRANSGIDSENLFRTYYPEPIPENCGASRSRFRQKKSFFLLLLHTT